MKALAADEFRGRVLVVCQRLIDSSDRLCAADRDLGDGDHGVTMARAFAAARDALRSAPLGPGEIGRASCRERVFLSV